MCARTWKTLRAGTVVSRPFLVNVLPIGLFLIGRAACAWAGLGMDIPWAYFQLLDRHELTIHPFWNLFLLHSQPPLLNALLALILNLGVVTGTDPRFWAAAVFFGLGATLAWGVFRLTLLLTKRFGLAMLATVLMLADPGHHVFQHQYFYPFMLQAMLVGMAICAFRFLAGGGAPTLFGAVGLIVLAGNTSSLYHPLWVLGLGVLLIACRTKVAGRRAEGRWVAPVALLTLLVGALAWPAKNWVVFGQFSVSTMEGLNMARGTTDLDAALAQGDWRREAADGLASLRRDYPHAPMVVLEARAKGDGSVNMNQYEMVTINPRLKALAVRWRRAHPGEWSRMVLSQYWMWTRAAYADSYGEALTVPGNATYRWYARLHQAVFYPDCEPVLESIMGRNVELVRSGLTRQRVPVTLFGLVFFPVILIGATVTNGVDAARRRDAAAMVCLVMITCILWVLVVPCLTDGQEGNRMRFAVDPFITILGLKLAHHLWAKRSTSTGKGSLRV